MNPIQPIQINAQPVAAIGNVELLNRPKTGLLCSRKCPADKILEAYDCFKKWAGDPEMTIISGFHSPVEKECLRLSKNWKPALEANRMLILSPFTEKRADIRTIARRNQLVTNLADDLTIPYASHRGNLSSFETASHE